MKNYCWVDLHNVVHRFQASSDSDAREHLRPLLGESISIDGRLFVQVSTTGFDLPGQEFPQHLLDPVTHGLKKP